MHAQAGAALKACDGSLERAADWLFSRGDTLDADVAAINNPAAAAATPAAAAGLATAMPGARHVAGIRSSLLVGKFVSSSSGCCQVGPAFSALLVGIPSCACNVVRRNVG